MESVQSAMKFGMARVVIMTVITAIMHGKFVILVLEFNADVLSAVQK